MRLKRVRASARRLHALLIKPRKRDESFRRWVGRNLDKSILGATIDLFQAFLGLIVTGLYGHKNWIGWNNTPDAAELRYFHAVIGSVFLFDYCLRFFAADNRQSYVLAPLAIMDFLAIFPQFTELVFSEAYHNAHILWFGAVRTLRPFRCLCFFRLVSFASTAKQRESLLLLITVTCIIICFGGMQQAIEACPCSALGANCTPATRAVQAAHCQNLTFYNAIYFVVITTATLGLRFGCHTCSLYDGWYRSGDIAPKSQMGRLAVIILIIASSLLLPLQISTLSDVLNRETEYDKAFTERKEKHPHVLICGDVNSGALDFFLRQFLHPTNMNWKDKVVILSPTLPSSNLKRILLNGAYEQRVKYLQGSAMLDSDLQRASASTARLCFVLANKLAPDADQSDTGSNFITISLRHHSKRVPIFVQVLKSDNVKHVSLSGADNILCVDQLKLGILAKSCLMPGTAALICSVLFTLRPLMVDQRDGSWAAEFLSGCSQHLHEVHLPVYLDRLVSFELFAHVLYHEYHMVSLGGCGGDGSYFLFTPSRVLGADMVLYVLSSDLDVAPTVAGLSLTTLQKYKARLPNFDKITQAWNRTTFTTKLRTAARASRASFSTSFKASVSRVGSLSNILRPGMNSAKPEPSAKSRVNSRVSPVLPYSFVDDETPDAPTSEVHSAPEDDALAPENDVPPSSPSHESGACPFLPTALVRHVVLCGMPHSLHDFVAPLRQERGMAPGLGGTHHLSNVPIVVIALSRMTPKEHAAIAVYSNVFFVQGSPLSLPTLLRARVHTSKSVVILRSCGTTVRNSSDLIDQNLVDMDAITVHRFISDVCAMHTPSGMPRPMILIELSRPNSLRFLSDDSGAVDNDERASMKRLTQLVISRADDPLDNICHPLYASGHVFIANALDALMGNCNKYGSVIDLVHLLVLGDDATGASCALDQIDVPRTLWGRPYIAAFEALLTHHGVLCLGVYRVRGDKANFVHVNPPPDVVLNAHDKLFVLH
ncbi:hypothetical protein SDRG_02969 [Saprolegnia diclina VS20]|uniref:BK channel n=1 Tax=Saprolegnia diclina (strain VS20) TaxID=1156394 RepID=T0QXZ3_SAPDV|nr:hypothetical protein SDRG_02969 [Saprolegnia diclina VS20]EQC39531.1 hypothetical protein SDRG_02969 [Saprolegnia diclina VS20]|eukprot:XP_008606803.1 hypothetical protein SDRG_02969 [Saprolegnia diclina VS20]